MCSATADANHKIRPLSFMISSHNNQYSNVLCFNAVCQAIEAVDHVIYHPGIFMCDGDDASRNDVPIWFAPSPRVIAMRYFHVKENVEKRVKGAI